MTFNPKSKNAIKITTIFALLLFAATTIGTQNMMGFADAQRAEQGQGSENACPPGFVLERGQCQANPCPEGEFRGGQCIVEDPTECPAGSVPGEENGQFVCITNLPTECPAGSVPGQDAAGKFVCIANPPAECPTGFVPGQDAAGKFVCTGVEPATTAAPTCATVAGQTPTPNAEGECTVSSENRAVLSAACSKIPGAKYHETPPRSPTKGHCTYGQTVTPPSCPNSPPGTVPVLNEQGQLVCNLVSQTGPCDAIPNSVPIRDEDGNIVCETILDEGPCDAIPNSVPIRDEDGNIVCETDLGPALCPTPVNGICQVRPGQGTR